MTDLREQLQQCFRGRVSLIGVGNVESGDDGFGVRLAEALAAKSEIRNPKLEGKSKSEGRNLFAENADSDFELRASFGFRASSFGFEILLAGANPERFIGEITDAGFDHLIFLDAVEFGGAPGSVVFLNAKQMANRFPQISTHKISLGMLAKWAESNGTTRAWLLGVQPESLKSGASLTPTVQRTLEMLAELLSEMPAWGSAQSAIRNPQPALVC
jgi:hydrogenase maturation protease